MGAPEEDLDDYKEDVTEKKSPPPPPAPLPEKDEAPNQG